MADEVYERQSDGMRMRLYMDGMSTDAVASRLGVRPSTVRRWRQRGQLPAVRFPDGRGWMFSTHQVEAIAENAGVGASALGGNEDAGENPGHASFSDSRQAHSPDLASTPAAGVPSPQEKQ